MKQCFLIILLLLVMTLEYTVQAQVTIGSANKPKDGALLDLKEYEDVATPGGITSQRGLVIPRVNISNLKPSTPEELAASIGNTGSWGMDDHTGLMVYNVSNREVDRGETCPGIHVWNGIEWEPIIPYSRIEERKVLLSVANRKFEYLESDPTHANFNISLWPLDKQAVALNGDYILGNSKTQQAVDIEGNDYNTSRFYVGYKTREASYRVERNYSCFSVTPNWISNGTIIEKERIFTDGVWTTEHLRTLTLPNGTAIDKHATNSTTDPQYFIPNNKSTITRSEGVLYNWAAAVNLGDGTNGTSVHPGAVNQGGGSQDDVLLQGVCPDGWYLPSDQDFIDLENGIIQKTSLFSSTPDIGSLLIYDTQMGRGTHGTAMKTNGTSKPSAEGGFDISLTGYAGNGGKIFGYGTANYIWSASKNTINYSWRRGVDSGTSTVTRYFGTDTFLFSVRCKKKDQ